MKLFKRLSLICVGLLFCLSYIPCSKIASADSLFSTSAAGTYLVDVGSGTVIFAENEDKRLPIASMTKIMLLDIVFDSIDEGKLSEDDYITVSENASGMGGSQVFLQANKNYKVSDLIKSIVVASANDASVALAENIAGTEEKFVSQMNAKATDMGLNDTLFSNCTGLPKPTQYSTAKDVAAMLKSLLRHSRYFAYSNIWLDEITHPDGSKTTITNTNKLSRFYKGCDGGKTGYTSESGFCLAATAKREEMRLICVVIGEENSKTRFGDVSRMFDAAFSNFKSEIVVDKTKAVEKPVLIKGSKSEYVSVYPKDNLSVFCAKGAEAENYSVDYTFTEDLKAPLKKGAVVGEVTLYLSGVAVSKTDLVVNFDVDRENYGDAIKKVASDW